MTIFIINLAHGALNIDKNSTLGYLPFATLKHFKNQRQDPRVSDTDQIDLSNNGFIGSDGGIVSQISVVHGTLRKRI